DLPRKQISNDQKQKSPSGGRRAFCLNWARLELNQHALAGTRPSTLRVCQFRHEPGFSPPVGKLAANMQVYRVDGTGSSCTIVGRTIVFVFRKSTDTIVRPTGLLLR